MKKILSLFLSFCLVLGTVTTLTMIPAVADEINTGNLIINGDAAGVDGKEIYTEEDVNDPKYNGLVVKGEAFGWRSSSGGVYGDCKTAYPHTISSVESGYYSNYSPAGTLILNNWRQAFQDVLLQKGVTYRVSAKIAANPKDFAAGATPGSDWTFAMMLDNVADSGANKRQVGYDWFLEEKIVAEKTLSVTGANGEETKAYYASGDFKEYSFIFNSNDFISAYGVAANADGLYPARFVMRNDSSFWLMFDDVEIVAVTQIKGGIMEGSEGAGSVSIPDSVKLGEKATFKATANFGNSFLGWYDAKGEFVSSSANFETDAYTELYAKFAVTNKFVDAGFENATLGDTDHEIFKDRIFYSNNYKATLEVVTNTDNTEVFGNQSLKYYSAASTAVSAGSQYDLMIPVQVEKNKKYLFRFYYKNTTANRVGCTISKENDWEGHATISYSYYNGTYGNKSTNTWSYGYAADSKLKNSNAAIKTHNASFTHTGWNEMQILFDSLENEGTLYLVIGMLHSASYDHTVYLDNLQFSEIDEVVENGTFKNESGFYSVSGASDANETFRFTTGASGTPIVYDDTYYALKGGNTVSYSATPSYGNGFLGWYSGDTLVSTETQFTSTLSLKPKFDKKNFISFGDFEDTLTHQDIVDEINGYEIRYGKPNNGTPEIIETENLENTDATHGDFVLKLTPAATSTAAKQKGLINIPVTVEKNTDYIWRFSYKFEEGITEFGSNSHALFTSVDGLQNGKIPWSGVTSQIKYTMHSQIAGTAVDSGAFKNGWSWGGSENGFGTLHAISDNGTNTKDKWQDVFILFNPKEEPYIFQNGSNTGTAYLTIGTANALTDAIYLDNISLTKAVSNANWTQVSQSDNGTTAVARLGESFYWYTPTARHATNSYNNLDKTNTYVPDMYLPVSAFADAEATFMGWFVDGEKVSGNDKIYIPTISNKTYRAEFETEAIPCTVTLKNEKQNGVYGGYLTGETFFDTMTNQTVTATAVAYEGNTFDGWYDGDKKVSGDATYTFKTTGTVTLVAKFNVANLWPDSGFENTEVGTEMLLDKQLISGNYTEKGWYSNVPSIWWSGAVKNAKPYSGSNSLELTHRNNEAMYDIGGLKKNTDYTLSFYWYNRSATNGKDTPSYFDRVTVYGENSLPLAESTYGDLYSTEFQKINFTFNTGDNTSVKFALVYVAGSGAVVLDDFCLTEGKDSSLVKVTYNSDDEKVASVHDYVASNSTYTLRAPKSTPAGKIFAGWSYGGATYKAGDSINIGATAVTVTALYTDHDHKGALADSDFYNPEDYDFSFVVLPDEQKVNSNYPGYFGMITDWILDNKDLYNIKGMLSVGDLTEGNAMNEWIRAKSAISRLNGVVPYVLAPGNHDYMNNTKAAFNSAYERRTDYFDYMFPESEQQKYANYGGSFDGSLINSYYKITTDNYKYIIMSLEIYPRDEVLEWANRIVSENPDHRVLVATHSHLDADGTRSERGESGGSEWYAFNDPENSNDANDVWNKFIKLHANIMMFISGHNSNSNTLYNKLKGDNGNTVYELLIDNQDDDINYKGVGNVLILGFDEEDGTVGVTNYSTLRNKYFRPTNNEFYLDVDMPVEKEGYGHVSVSTTQKGGKTVYNYVAKPYYSNTFVGWYDNDGNFVSANLSYSSVTYPTLKAIFEGANTYPNGDLEYNDDLSFANGRTNSFSIKDYEKDEGNGDHYLSLKNNGQETSHNSFVMPVKKNTDYTISFDMKIKDFGANGWFRAGISYAPNKWDAVAILNSATQTYRNPNTNYTLTFGLDSKNKLQPGGGLDARTYTSNFDSSWIHFTTTFNSGSDANVFGTGDEGVMYFMLYNFNNGMDIMLDNVVFGTASEVKAHVQGYGSATTDKQSALPGETVTFTATAGFGSSFEGWYSGNVRVSQDSVFQTCDYLSLTARFKNYGAVSDAGFENGTTGDFVARGENWATFENAAHEEPDSYFGNNMLKVTASNKDYLTFYVPAKVEANTKYLIHFSYKVEAYVDTRTDIMVGPKNSWSNFTDSTFYASSSIYSFSKGTAFGQYQSNNLKKHFGDGFIEMNVIVDTADELIDDNLYILFGAKDGATFYIDNVSVTKISDVSLYMVGATLTTETSKYYNEGTLSYASGLNFISPATRLKEMGTITIPTQLIPAGEELTKNTADVSVAKIRNSSGLYFDAKQFYATFRGTENFNPGVKLSARSYSVLSDIHGKYEWTFYSENNNEASNIVNGVYNRSITQIRRLLALALINNFEGNYPEDFWSEDDVSETDNVKSSASVTSEEAWNFVKRNAYLYGVPDLRRELNENPELWANGDFEDTDAYLGAIEQLLVDAKNDGLNYNNDTSKSVMYQYDHDGWVYYSGADYYIPDKNPTNNSFKHGAMNYELTDFIYYVNSSETKPHSGNSSLKLSTRSGNVCKVIEDLEPHTEYELSYYWKGGEYIFHEFAYVYPYIYEFFPIETYYAPDTSDSDQDGDTTETFLFKETINGVEYRFCDRERQRYFSPDTHAFYAESLAFNTNAINGNNDWQKITIKFNTENHTSVVLGLHYSARVNAGAIYVDDFSLKKCDTVVDTQFKNNTFANGLENWNGYAATYKVGGASSASFKAEGQRLWQTVKVERNTDYTVTVKAKTREANALHFGVTDVSKTSLNAITALSNSSQCITSGTGTETYTFDFHSGNSEYVNLHLQSLVDSRTTVFSVDIEKVEKSIVYDKVDFENGVINITNGIGRAYALAKTNAQWYSFTTSQAHSGNTSLVMLATSKDTNAQTDFVTNDGDTLKHPLYQKWSSFPVIPGNHYKVSYYVKSKTAGNSYDSSIRFVDQTDWDYFHALDKKTITLSNTDWTYVEHTFYADFGLQSNYYVDFVVGGNDNTTSDLYFDDIVFEEALPRIEGAAPEKLYTESIFNLIPDNDIEDGGSDYTSKGATVISSGAYNGQKALRVNAGTRIVLPIKTYVQYNYIPNVFYTFSAAVRKSSGGNGYVGISYTADGRSFYKNASGTADGSILTANSTDWVFQGFTYSRQTVTPTYLVIECTAGYIDVDMMSLFTHQHAFKENPNVEVEGYDYDTTVGAVANGGSTQSGATTLTISNYNSSAYSSAVCTTFTGIGKTVYHGFVEDSMGREYSEEQLDFELQKMKEAGITMARTMFRSQWAYTGNDADPWDWDTPQMQQFYAWCNKLAEYDIDVTIIPCWSVPGFVYGATSIPDVAYLYPRLLDENGDIQYTVSWGILHPAIDFSLACERYAEFATQAVEALYSHNITNARHVLTFNEPCHPNGALYKGAHAKQMLQLVETYVDKLKTTTLPNGQTAREYVTLIGPNQANVTNSGLATYFVLNGKYGYDLYDIWTTHTTTTKIGQLVGPENDMYDNAYERYTEILTNSKNTIGNDVPNAKTVNFKNSGKPFWCDEFGTGGYPFEQKATDEDQRWQGVNLAGQYVGLINSGMSGGILWQFADNSWTYLAGSGGEFAYGIHMTGATRSALQTQTPYYVYYATTLLTKYASSRENAKSFKGSSNNYIHSAAINFADGNWTIVVVNNNTTEQKIKVSTTSSLGGKTMYRHVYAANEIELESGANILDADKTFTNVTRTINDTIPAGSVVVYTSIKG